MDQFYKFSFNVWHLTSLYQIEIEKQLNAITIMRSSQWYSFYMLKMSQGSWGVTCLGVKSQVFMMAVLKFKSSVTKLAHSFLFKQYSTILTCENLLYSVYDFDLVVIWWCSITITLLSFRFRYFMLGNHHSLIIFEEIGRKKLF